MPTRSATLTLHLPGVRLTSEGAGLANGRAGALAFDDWQRLDGTFGFAESNYSRSRPVFWVGPITFDDAVDDSELAAIAATQEQIHDAFLLDSAVPWLPSPAMSTCYIEFASLPEYADVVLASTRAMIGPMEREWIVFGSDIREPFDTARLAAVQQSWEIIECARIASGVGPARAALATLERTARPDSWWGTRHGASVIEFLQCVATCETLLALDDSASTLTDAFARHAAALTAPAPADRDALAVMWGAVYRLRSDFVHGRRGLTELDDDGRALLPQPRRLLRDIAEALLRLAASHPPTAEPLPELLARAWSSATEHAALRQQLNAHAR